LNAIDLTSPIEPKPAGAKKEEVYQELKQNNVTFNDLVKMIQYTEDEAPTAQPLPDDYLIGNRQKQQLEQKQQADEVVSHYTMQSIKGC